MSTSSTPAIESTFAILELVTASREGPGFTEILDALPQSRASVARFLKWMTEAGYLSKAKGRYRPGHRLAVLASRVSLKDSLKEIADPIILEASETLEHTCIFFSWDGEHHESLIKHLHPASIVMQVLNNVTRDLTFTPWGWITLATLEDSTGKPWQEISAPERHSIKVIDEQVALARKRGYALDDLGRSTGIRRLAVPVVNADRALIGVIGMGAIDAALPDKKLPPVVKALKGYAVRISEQL